MSAWYVWSALGLYPETPGTADLAIGSPLFPPAVVSVGGSGGTLTIDAPAAADADPYVQGLAIDGTASSLAYLPAADVLSGTATLDFTLGSSADTSWGSAAADAPPSYGGTPGTGVKQNVGPITETQTGKCVDDRGSGTSNGTAIQIYTCNGTSAQSWTVVPDHTLQVLTDCMDVVDGGTSSGTLVQLHTCNGTGAQQWDRSAAGELVNPESGLCLTDASNGATNSTQLDIAACTGAALGAARQLTPLAGAAAPPYRGGMAAASAPDRAWAVWARVSPAPGQVLDLLHARMAEPFAPHVHDGFSIGVCLEGLEMIRYRGRRYYAAPGSVVILPPGEAHTGGPSDGTGFVYRVMYPAAELLADGAARPPLFPEPVVMDPALAAGLRRVHAALSRAARGSGPLPAGPGPAGAELARAEPAGAGLVGTEPLETESQLCWLFGELVRRHATPAGPADGLPGMCVLARQVMDRLADQLTCPPALAELAADAGLSRYQLLRAFRAEVGMPPYAWLAQHRVARARLLLEQGHRPADAATLTGFADQAHLTRWFRRVVGVTPGAYRNGVQDSRRPHR